MSIQKLQRKPCGLKAAARRVLELDDLPDDLLFEVLARVPTVTSKCPAKAAADLREVSRRWNSIISSRDYIPRFISLGEENNCPWGNGEALLLSYLSTSAAAATGDHPSYMLPSQCDPTVSIQSGELNFGYIPGNHFVIGASEDLLLLRDSPWSKISLVVCNPFVKRWSVLPVLPLLGDNDFAVVCDPQGNGYRVVSIDAYTNFRRVFVSEFGKWKNVGWMMYNGYRPRPRSNILPFRGKLYVYIYGVQIVAYDPFMDSFDFFPSPLPEGADYRGEFILGAVHGSLRMMRTEEADNNYENHKQLCGLIIWELDHKRRRWTLIYKSLFEGSRLVDLPMAFHPNGHVVYLESEDGFCFLDLSKGCNVLSRLPIKKDDAPASPNPFGGIFLLKRPWRPTSVSYYCSSRQLPTI